MKILFAASEAAPFVKTGGLADVAGSLPGALADAGAEVSVILPLYGSIGSHWRSQMTFLKYFYVNLSWRSIYCGLFRLKRDNVTYYFVDNEHYFKRGEPYGYYDDGERFGYFCRAVVESIPHLDARPEIIHCNDWQTALIPIYLKEEADRFSWPAAIKTVFTIHNIEYQGRYGRETLGDLFGLPSHWLADGSLEYYGDVCLLKGAILTADFVTTVSPTYAKELRNSFYGKGMEGVIQDCCHKMRGILNGIDTKTYDPSADPGISANYSVGDLSGKAKNKRALQHSLGLRPNPETPIIACISRLVSHKGFDLVTSALPAMMDMDVQFVLLGRGDFAYEQAFLNAERQYPDRLSAKIMYSPGLSMNIYAGADLFLMPSKSEPCGLSQMIAMRYGAVPVVRETGGLFDTVVPYNEITGAGNGFTFSYYSADDMLHVLRMAVSCYHKKDVWHTLMKRGMTADFSWNKSAAEYLDLYRQLLN